MKITFNKPAVVGFLLDGKHQLYRFLAIVRDKGSQKLTFRPTNNSEADIVPIVLTERGSAIVILSGYLQPEDYSFLLNPYDNPFFLLDRGKGGQIIPTPFAQKSSKTGLIEPSRTIPWLRVWWGNRLGASQPRNNLNIAGEVFAAIRELSAYAELGIKGRPPQSIIDAQNQLVSFEEVARLCLPVYSELELIYKKIALILDRPMGDGIIAHLGHDSVALLEELASHSETTDRNTPQSGKTIPRVNKPTPRPRLSHQVKD